MAGSNARASFGTFAETYVASLSVDDIIRAAKAAGVRLTDSDVVAIACAQAPGSWGMGFGGVPQEAEENVRRVS